MGEGSVEAAWQPPGLLAEQREHGWDERHSHDECIDEDADAEAEVELEPRRMPLFARVGGRAEPWRLEPEGFDAARRFGDMARE